MHFAALVNTYKSAKRSSLYHCVFKRLHSATIVALKRNVTFILTATVHPELDFSLLIAKQPHHQMHTNLHVHQDIQHGLYT